MGRWDSVIEEYDRQESSVRGTAAVPVAGVSVPGVPRQEDLAPDCDDEEEKKVLGADMNGDGVIEVNESHVEKDKPRKVLRL